MALNEFLKKFASLENFFSFDNVNAKNLIGKN